MTAPIRAADYRAPLARNSFPARPEGSQMPSGAPPLRAFAPLREIHAG